MNKILKIDDYLVELAQEIYLRIWDWTGVTIAALGFVMIAVAEILVETLRDADSLYTKISFAIVLIPSVYNHHLQLNHPATYNGTAEWARYAFRPFRICLAVCDAGQGVAAAAHLDWIYVIYSSLWFASWFLLCAKTRKREPPEWKSFFQRKDLAWSSTR